MIVPLHLYRVFKNAVRATKNQVKAEITGSPVTESGTFSTEVGAIINVIRDEAIVDLNRAQIGLLAAPAIDQCG